MVRTDPAARAALRAAGKVAATRGNVIHLTRDPGSSVADAALLAHELTHVAHPSPEPRFFDDDRRSSEERAAEEIARQVSDVIRRSPVLPRATAAPVAPSIARHRRTELSPPVPAVIRRQVDHPAAPRSNGAAGTTSADDFAARLAGTTRGSDQVLRRNRTRANAGAPARIAPVPAPATTNSTPTAPPQQPARARSAPIRWQPPIPGNPDSSATQDMVDWIIEQVEERMVRQIERRGGRYRGDF
jgi:Domain of unknown function (DUF4157)